MGASYSDRRVLSDDDKKMTIEIMTHPTEKGATGRRIPVVTQQKFSITSDADVEVKRTVMRAFLVQIELLARYAERLKYAHSSVELSVYIGSGYELIQTQAMIDEIPIPSEAMKKLHLDIAVGMEYKPSKYAGPSYSSRGEDAPYTLFFLPMVTLAKRAGFASVSITYFGQMILGPHEDEGGDLRGSYGDAEEENDRHVHMLDDGFDEDD